MTPRWVIERKGVSIDRKLLLVIEVYSPTENKEIVKEENKQWTYKRELLLVE